MRGYSSILGPVDSAFYYVEHPETPMNIGALAIFDGIIDFDKLMEHIDTRLHLIPRYRDRIVQAPLNLGQPTWIPDPNFYIGNHVKCGHIEPPGTERELRQLAGELLSRMLDRSRPLWEIYVLDGLPNQTVVFFKVHHCLVDGLAAVELFTFLTDVSKDSIPESAVHKPLYDPPDLPYPVELTIDSLKRDISHQFGLLQKLGKETLRLGGVLTDREKRLKMAVAVTHLVNNNLKPIKKLPINGTNSGSQHMSWAEFPLEDIHAVRALCGASVNDVMLSLLTKAVEHYVAENGGTSQPFLRILVPFNIRDKAEDEEYGNRISVLPLDIPFNVTHPLEHLKAVTQFSKVMKESSLIYSMDLMLTLPSLMPAVTHSTIWGIAPTAFSILAHTWCTNVAATPFPIYMLGHEMKHVYGYFPLNPSMGLACVIVSYNGRITMTLITDEGIVKDAPSLERHLKQAYADLINCLPKPQPPIVSANQNGSHSTNGVCKQNGSTTEPIEIPISIVAVAEKTPQPVLVKTKYKLFSEDWAKAMRESVNHSEAYHKASTNWNAGPLAFVMEAAPNQGFEAPVAVLLDLYRGICRASRALSTSEAMREAVFVIQGNYSAWMDVLSGHAAPLMMLTNGRLKLSKGALIRLLPHTRSASELVRCAQKVPWE